MKNIKVVLVYDSITAHAKASATRVIDSSSLRATTQAGRFEEAKAIYNQMVGIKATGDSYEISETDDRPSQFPEMVKSSAGDLKKAQEKKTLDSVAAILSNGISKGLQDSLGQLVNAALATANPSQPASEQPVEEDEQPVEEDISDDDATEEEDKEGAAVVQDAPTMTSKPQPQAGTSKGKGRGKKSRGSQRKSL